MQDDETSAPAAKGRKGAESRIRQLLAQLTAGTDAEREFACRALSGSLSSSAEHDGGLRPHDICAGFGTHLVDAVCPLLLNPDPSVSIGATGALRNLCTVGGPSLCARAVAAGAVGACVAVLRERAARLANAAVPDGRAAAAPADGHEGEDEVETAAIGAANVLLLLSEIAENDESGLAQVTNSGLPATIAAELVAAGPASGPIARFPELRNAAGNSRIPGLLFTATEDNPALSARLLADGSFLPACLAVVSPRKYDEEVTALLCGSVINAAKASGDADLELRCATAMLPHLQALLAANAEQALAGLEQALCSDASETSELDAEATEVFANVAAPAALAPWKALASAQCIALELVANLCCDTDFEVPAVDDVMEVDEQADESRAQQAAAQQQQPQQPERLSRMLEMMSHAGIEPAIFGKVSLTAPELVGRIVGHAPLLERHLSPLIDIETRALSCLNNMALYFPASNLGDLQAMWNHLEAVLSRAMDAEPEMADECSGVMWSLARRFLAPSLASPAWAPGVGPWMRALLSDCDRLPVNAAGVLGILARLPHLAESVEAIGDALVVVATSQTATLELSATAIDSLIDVFAEPPADARLWGVHMRVAQALSGLSVGFRRRVFAEKKEMDPPLWERVDEIRLNLVQFNKYKKGQHPPQ
eukprot:m51a1_g14762 hypothetical protein (655) ;mRNA; f:346118-348378